MSSLAPSFPFKVEPVKEMALTPASTSACLLSASTEH